MPIPALHFSSLCHNNPLNLTSEYSNSQVSPSLFRHKIYRTSPFVTRKISYASSAFTAHIALSQTLGYKKLSPPDNYGRSFRPSRYNAFPVNTDESNGVWGNRRYQLKGPCVSSLYSPKEIRTGQSVGKPNRQNILVVSSPFLRRSRKDSSLGCDIAKDVRIFFIPARPIVVRASTRGFFESALIVFPHCTFWDLIPCKFGPSF